MLIKALTGSLFTLALAACVAPMDEDGHILEGPPVKSYSTPYDTALTCMRDTLDTQKIPRIILAVGAIADATGKENYSDEGTGKYITQGLPHVLIGILGQNKLARQVSRLDTRIFDWERTRAKNKELGDGVVSVMTADGSKEIMYRPLRVGGILGAQFEAQGSVHSLDWAISDGGAQFQIAGIGPGYRQFRSMIGMTLYIIDMDTSEILDTESVRKVVTGDETTLGAFRFFGQTLVNASAGAGRHEAINNFAVRAMMQYATFNLMERAYKEADFSLCRQFITDIEGVEDAPAT